VTVLVDGSSSARLGSLVNIGRDRIDPSKLGDDLLIHYSIPTLDETDEPILEAASAIGSHKFRVGSDAVLVSLLNPRIPRIWRAEGGRATVCSTEFAVLTPRDERQLSIEFLYLLCRSTLFWEQLQLRAVGTTGSRQRVNAEALLDVEVDLPTLREQWRIVDLMGTIDHVVGAAVLEQTASNEALAALRRALFAPQPSWQHTSLGAVAGLKIGRTPRRAEPAFWTDSTEHPFLTIADLTRWDVGKAREGVTQAAIAKGQARAVPPDQLIMSFKLSIGRVGITDRWVYTNEAIVWIEPGNECRRDYLAHWLASRDLSVGTVRAVKGATLNSGSLAAIEVALPSLDRQHEIERMLEAQRLNADVCANGIGPLRDLRSCLLTALLCGEIDIPESYDRFLGAS